MEVDLKADGVQGVAGMVVRNNWGRFFVEKFYRKRGTKYRLRDRFRYIESTYEKNLVLGLESMANDHWNLSLRFFHTCLKSFIVR